MSLETLEFTIFPDGRVQEKVTGIVGTSCEEVTAKIEEQLGRTIAREQTSDYYKAEQPVGAQTTTQSQAQSWATPSW